MTEFQSVDDFLNYKGSENSGAKRLKNWKEKGYLNFWLHTKQFPCAVWYHSLPELVVRTKKDDPSVTMKNVWSRSHVCWEDETVLKKQRFRNANGEREHPPKRCGLCRLNEAIRAMIRSGQIKDTDVLFRFEGSDKPEENRVLHAGGLTGYWGRDLDDATKSRLAQHGIYMGNAPGRPGVWAQSSVAKLSYIFVGVDNDDVTAGLQTAVQSQLIGDKVKREINNQIASEGGDRGNPFVNPYCIQILYKSQEKKFDDKYDARRVNRFQLTPQIEALIRGDKPDLSRFTKKFDQSLMRAMMEEHATDIGKRLPWDEIFAVRNEPAAPFEAPPVKTQVQVPAAVPAATAGPEMIPCDDCGTLMREDQTKCPKCGAVYEVDTAASAAPATTPKAPAASQFTEPEGVYDEDVPF